MATSLTKFPQYETTAWWIKLRSFAARRSSCHSKPPGTLVQDGPMPTYGKSCKGGGSGWIGWLMWWPFSVCAASLVFCCCSRVSVEATSHPSPFPPPMADRISRRRFFSSFSIHTRLHHSMHTPYSWLRPGPYPAGYLSIPHKHWLFTAHESTQQS